MNIYAIGGKKGLIILILRCSCSTPAKRKYNSSGHDPVRDRIKIFLG
jgi:hypothetical protein